MKIIFNLSILLFLTLTTNAQTVLQQSFIGPVTGGEVLFNIYLPEGYETSTSNFPVIYHLHGLFGSQGGDQNNFIPAVFEEALETGKITKKYIIVFPNGMTNSMWANSKSGHKPVETNVIEELIPYVDANFKTLSTKENRYIQGYSMGGFGAAKFIGKYPELFQSAVIFDGALHTWNTFKDRHADLATEIFGDDEAYFNEYAPWQYFEENTKDLASSICIRIISGGLKLLNLRFRDALVAWEMPFEYIETTCTHNIKCILEQDGINAAIFQENCSPMSLAIDTSPSKTDWYIYPNPTKGKITLQMEKNYNDLEVSIFSMLGEKVLTVENLTEVSISHLKVGTYIVRVNKNGKISSRKILKLE